jgi:hypothetical protein
MLGSKKQRKLETKPKTENVLPIVKRRKSQYTPFGDVFTAKWKPKG